jgi:hypothetical protein
MASKKAGRLAGLAALAGLAYMANEKGKGAKDTAAENNRIADARAAREEEKGPASKPSDEAKKEDAVDTGDFLSRRLNRIDTDDGLAYSTNNLSPMSSPASRTPKAPKAPSASVAAPSAPAVKAPIVGGPTPARDPGGAGKRGAVSPGPNPARAPGGVGKRGGVGDEEKANMMDLPPYRENKDTSDMSMKRGGKVKKMASGGMTSSASKRGDGIASKGKTRGRMC